MAEVGKEDTNEFDEVVTDNLIDSNFMSTFRKAEK